VSAHVIASELEGATVANIKRKEADAERMAAAWEMVEEAWMLKKHDRNELIRITDLNWHNYWCVIDLRYGKTTQETRHARAGAGGPAPAQEDPGGLEKGTAPGG
jgi:hypothetical protein